MAAYFEPTNNKWHTKNARLLRMWRCCHRPPPSLVWAKHLHRAGKRVGRSEGTSELQKAVRPSLFVPKDTRRGVWISFHSSSLTPEKCNRSETALRQKGWAHARLTHDSVQSQHFELGTFPFFASQLVTIFLKSTKPAGHKSNEVFHKAGRCSPYDCPREKPSEIAFFLKTLHSWVRLRPTFVETKKHSIEFGRAAWLAQMSKEIKEGQSYGGSRPVWCGLLRVVTLCALFWTSGDCIHVKAQCAYGYYISKQMPVQIILPRRPWHEWYCQLR